MTKQNETKKAITLLGQKLKEADNPTLGSDEYEFEQWTQEIEGTLANYFGGDSRQLKNFKDSLHQEVRVIHHYGGEGIGETEYRMKQIGHAKATLSAILSEVESFGFPAIEETTTPPKAFIAHGGKSKALSKLQNFMAVLGITPLVAEEEPSEGRSVDEQVEWCLNNSDCAIILGTADDKNLKDGKLYPRPNVCIEIGRVQERLPRRVIYLLEETASFPSNISEKVYERFTPRSMDKAFIKIAKELTGWDLIRASKAEAETNAQDI